MSSPPPASPPTAGSMKRPLDDAETPPQKAPEPQVAAWLVSRFEDKDEIKSLGGQYFGQRQQWYVPLGVDTAPFSRWLPQNTVYLTCPFAEKDEAKALGAKWDARNKKWFVPPGADTTPFKKWLKAGAAAAPSGGPAAVGTPNGDAATTATSTASRERDSNACFRCGAGDHWARNCPKAPTWSGGSGASSSSPGAPPTTPVRNHRDEAAEPGR